MSPEMFNNFLQSIFTLTDAQKQKLLESLSEANELNLVDKIERSYSPKCPCCGSLEIIKWGKQSGLQRYRCKSCKSTHNVLTNTPLAKIRDKSKLSDYCQSMSDKGESLRSLANRLNISLDTSFNWRHKLLDFASKSQPDHISGIVEADETFFPLSFKGQRGGLPRASHKRGSATKKRGTSKEKVPVLIVRNRSGLTADFKLAHNDTDNIKTSLEQCLASDAVLCSDGAAAYRIASQKMEISHECVNLSKKERIRGAWHIQNVNAYDSRLKQWMQRFHGVATKYLEHYLAWQRILDQWKDKLHSLDFLNIAIGRSYPHQLINGT